ncbi:ArdC family protein [Mucilaginibacter sp. UYCu711]|uniref:ArdC family protein n=1 Tax=Mucilaginibacter sp. UYCu711 TaxID=3156339 RepID=UPI003D19F45D
MATTQKLNKKTTKKSVKPAFVLKDTYQEVTDAVIQALEEDTIVWRCTWNRTGFPKNITTNKNYRGWNLFWLDFHTMRKGYETPFYLTYKQAAELGGTIKRGERGVKITYWATIDLKNQTVEITDKVTGEVKEGHPTKLVPKDYTVFNIAQTEGIEFPKVEALFCNDAEKIDACEKVIEGMPLRPTIEYHGDRAYYQPGTDNVVVPRLEAFQSNEGFYSTLFHELAHSTGHNTRLNRKELTDCTKFGDESYSKEELTAELTAAFLCATTGIKQQTLPNSAAYIASWLKALKNDKTLILKAAAQAQKAADFILADTQEEVHP